MGLGFNLGMNSGLKKTLGFTTPKKFIEKLAGEAVGENVAKLPFDRAYNSKRFCYGEKNYRIRSLGDHISVDKEGWSRHIDPSYDTVITRTRDKATKTTRTTIPSSTYEDVEKVITTTRKNGKKVSSISFRYRDPKNNSMIEVSPLKFYGQYVKSKIADTANKIGDALITVLGG